MTPEPSATRFYVVAGVSCTVTATVAMLELVDETYGAYGADHHLANGYSLRVVRTPAGLLVEDSEGRTRPCEDDTDAAFGLIEGVVRHVTAQLAREGIYAIHAASLAVSHGGLLICGKSRSGKTTLALALLAHGFQLLSDEFALSAPDARTILPYHRGVHVRAGTPELIPFLSYVSDLPHHPLSGGFQWTLSPAELERVMPGCLASQTELRWIVLLDPRSDALESTLEPISEGVAAVELVRQTTAAAANLTGALERMTQLVSNVPCFRLSPGRLESTVAVLQELTGAVVA